MTQEMEMDEVIRSLRKAIEGDKRFFLEAKNDPNLEPIRPNVNKLLTQLTIEAKKRAEKGLQDCLQVRNQVDFNWNPASSKKAKIEKGLVELSKLIAGKSYFGYLDAEELSRSIQETLKDFAAESLVMFGQQIESFDSKIQACDKIIAEHKKNLLNGSNLNWGWVVGSFIWLSIPSWVVGAMQKSRPDWLIFLFMFVVPPIPGIIVMFIDLVLSKGRSRQKYLPLIEQEENKKLAFENERSQAKSSFERIRQIDFIFSAENNFREGKAS